MKYLLLLAVLLGGCLVYSPYQEPLQPEPKIYGGVEVEPGRGWYCFKASTNKLNDDGRCRRTLPKCQAVQDFMKFYGGGEIYHAVSECVYQDAAYVMLYLDNGKVSYEAMPSIYSCERVKSLNHALGGPYCEDMGVE
jgi:hypothetical protein